MNFNLLSLIVFLPLVGVLAIALIPRLSSKAVKYLALVATLSVLALALLLLFFFDRGASGIQFEELYSWIPAINAHYHLGVDGISLPMVVLTAFLGLVAVLISWKVENRVKEFFIWLLVLESSILGVFCSLDLLLFFVFWEIEVIPMYFLISIWGNGRKQYSATKYVIYTLAGSALMLAGIVSLYYATDSLDMVALANNGYAMAQSVLPAAPIFFLLLAGFAVKLPVFPLHTWLPDAHTDAPTAASVFLAGALIKMGGYGMIRLVSIFPPVAQQYAPILLGLAVTGVVYGGAITLRQTDLKRLIAYSSISHMGFVLLGIFALSQTSLVGASLQMVSHGLITGLLFAVAGIIMHNTHERDISKMGGLARQMPAASTFFILGGLGALGLPATSGFAAEFTTFLGSFTSTEVSGVKIFVLVALLGVLLAAAYILWLIQRVFFGPVLPVFNEAKDADKLQKFYCGMFIALIFFIGIYPSSLTSIIQNSAAGVIKLLGG
ncbi:MAG: NADH-quinone oxidoreductase subunit M [Dehalococcoidia bacterium]|nr:MAG: NADH-quinone oxidoreductase subunit M [Dehalococcoidia bacterium]